MWLIRQRAVSGCPRFWGNNINYARNEQMKEINMFKILALIIGGVGGIITLDVVSYLWTGYVLSILWGWFIIPIFSLPPLSIPTAIGIAVISGLLTHQSRSGKEEGSSAFGQIIAFNFISPAAALLIGWIVKGYL